MKSKTVVIFAGYGATGEAVATSFANAGAHVVVTGRDLKKAQAVRDKLKSAGLDAVAGEVDALDESQVERTIRTAVEKTGRIDVVFNAIGLPQQGIQGTPLLKLDVDNLMAPVSFYLKSHYLTSKYAATHMMQQKSGVILFHTPEPARIAAPLTGGMSPAWAAMESLSRLISAETAQFGVRTVVIRTTGIPETRTIDMVYGQHAKAAGMSYEQFKLMLEGFTHTKRSTTLIQLGHAAVYAASSDAGNMTGAVLNLTGGMIAD